MSVQEGIYKGFRFAKFYSDTFKQFHDFYHENETLDLAEIKVKPQSKNTFHLLIIVVDFITIKSDKQEDHLYTLIIIPNIYIKLDILNLQYFNQKKLYFCFMLLFTSALSRHKNNLHKILFSLSNLTKYN